MIFQCGCDNYDKKDHGEDKSNDDDDAILAHLGGQVVTGGEVLEPEGDECNPLIPIPTISPT